MKIIDRIKEKTLTGTISFTLAVVIAGSYLAGAPIPGRYQVISSSSESVVMVDTATGKIRVFSFRKLGSSS